jgi:hypothetical protein
MLDDALLDDPVALERADTDGALLALAGAGARIRNALRLADEAGLSRLQPDGRPRAVLVAGHGSALTAGDILASMGGSSCPVLLLGPADAAPSDTGLTGTRGPLFASDMGWHLPGWAGPIDLVVVASADGSERGLSALVEQAYVRGSSIVVIAPAGSPLADAAVQARGLPLPFARANGGQESPQTAESDLPPEDPGALWAFAAPLLALAGRIGIIAVDADSLQAAADRLDEVAVRCRPDADAFVNPGKSLASQLAGGLPLLWGDGPLTAAAARRFCALLADRAGQPALTGVLPDALPAHRGLFAARLSEGGAGDDFFRDRVDEPDPLRLQVLLLRHTLPLPGTPEYQSEPDGPESGREERAEERTSDESREGGPDIGPPPAASAGAAAVRHSLARAQRLADAHGVAINEIASSRVGPAEALAELVGLADFAAVYLGLATTRGRA